MDSVFNHAGVVLAANGIATVTIRSAGVLNILSTRVIKDLTIALQNLGGLPELRVVILRGTGDRAFVAGADIKEMRELNAASAKDFIDNLRQLCETVREIPVPVIARIPGWALGGGLELALACDLRIASSTAYFGMPEVKVGIPSIIHAALLPRLVGAARTNWLLLAGENVDAARALAWGLVDEVVEPSALDAAIERMASLLASYGPSVVRQQKRLLREWQAEPLDVSIRNGVDEFASAFMTGEPQAFMANFAAKQKS